MADLRILIDTAELDKTIEKAERLRDILKEYKELQTPIEIEVEPLKFSCEKCCDCPYKKTNIYEPWTITRNDIRTSALPKIIRNYYTCSSD